MTIIKIRRLTSDNVKNSTFMEKYQKLLSQLTVVGDLDMDQFRKQVVTIISNSFHKVSGS